MKLQTLDSSTFRRFKWHRRLNHYYDIKHFMKISNHFHNLTIAEKKKRLLISSGHFVMCINHTRNMAVARAKKQFYCNQCKVKFEYMCFTPVDKHIYRIQPQKDRKVHVPYQCVFYSKKGSFLTVDHIIPKAKGGENSIDNYQILCNHCNARKSNKLIKTVASFDSKYQPAILDLTLFYDENFKPFTKFELFMFKLIKQVFK